MIYEAHIDTSRPELRIISQPSGRTYLTTPAALISALQQATGGPIAPAARSISWTDLLSTHGVAVGRRNAAILTLALLPPTLRSIRWSGVWTPSPDVRRSETLDLNVTFPPMLVGLKTEEGRYVKAGLYVIQPTAQPTLAVTSTAPTLHAFGFGNVYIEGHVCWGTVEHAQITSIQLLLHTFFSSGFNHDLYTAGQECLPKMARDHANILTPPASYPLSIATVITRLNGGD